MLFDGLLDFVGFFLILVFNCRSFVEVHFFELLSIFFYLLDDFFANVCVLEIFLLNCSLLLCVEKGKLFKYERALITITGMVIGCVAKLPWKFFDGCKGGVRVSAVYENLLDANLGKEILFGCVRLMKDEADVKALDIYHD
jgi:hypothetical protein